MSNALDGQDEFSDPMDSTSSWIPGPFNAGPRAFSYILSWRRGRVSGAALLGARRGMRTTPTTIWRPNVRVTLDEYGEVEDTESGGEEVTKKGTKRKRAPYTKGPCEHGVKYRSQCKVCSACPHGRRRSECKECGGGSICEHGRIRYRCKECRAVKTET